MQPYPSKGQIQRAIARQAVRRAELMAAKERAKAAQKERTAELMRKRAKAQHVRRTTETVRCGCGAEYVRRKVRDEREAAKKCPACRKAARVAANAERDRRRRERQAFEEARKFASQRCTCRKGYLCCLCALKGWPEQGGQRGEPRCMSGL